MLDTSASLRYFHIAHELNEEHKEKLKSLDLHFRGNVKSISLISLHPDTPEIGISGITTKEKAIKELEKADFKKPKRDTPEKQLQAYIIRTALKNDNYLSFDINIQFLTSELAIYNEKGKRVVTDILGIDNQNNLIVIELKSSRLKTRIEEQIDNYTSIIEQEQAFFSALVKLLTNGRKWSGDVKKMGVCPKATRVNRKVLREDVREVVYELDAEGEWGFEEL